MSSHFQTARVTSADGTPISYRIMGNGPTLIIVPGASALAEEFDGIASALAASFTVATIDRRGHGKSGSQGPRYSLERELEDIEAAREATGAQFLLGHSFGGFLVLETLRKSTSYAGAAVYEPGVFVDETTETLEMEWADRSAKEFAAGKQRDAFITFIRGVNPETTGKAPRATLKLILPFAMGRTELTHKAGVIPETIREHREAARVGNQPSRYAQIKIPVLFMAGKDITTTAAGRATQRLSLVLPNATLTTFPKLDHFGMEKAPATVAEVVTAAFNSSTTASQNQTR
ncbi:MAG: alpha/beta hydrolase fold [Microbacteriaceae bacterium]|jgi:pimeloyl-ACP methyl ester carboxylesterase|nr:alpha/beta hydrolase fold [Microbacteriaceae bacterium]